MFAGNEAERAHLSEFLKSSAEATEQMQKQMEAFTNSFVALAGPLAGLMQRFAAQLMTQYANFPPQPQQFPVPNQPPQQFPLPNQTFMTPTQTLSGGNATQLLSGGEPRPFFAGNPVQSFTSHANPQQPAS